MTDVWLRHVWHVFKKFVFPYLIFLTNSGVQHIVCCVFALFVYVLCLVYSMLPVSLNGPFLIAPSVFSNIYLLQNRVVRTKIDTTVFIVPYCKNYYFAGLRHLFTFSLMDDLYCNVTRLVLFSLFISNNEEKCTLVTHSIKYLIRWHEQCKSAFIFDTTDNYRNSISGLS
jgi:hypothetical protein